MNKHTEEDLEAENEQEGGWSPYLAGGLLGILAVFSAWITTLWIGKTNFLGASTTFVRAAGFTEKAFAPEYVIQNLYFIKEKVVLDWQFMLIVGVLIGAFLASMTDKSFKLESIPPVWEQRFGSSIVKRGLGAFFGGIVAMIGARLADGCPSGHGLSGLMQLSVSGIVALCLFFVFGSLAAHFIYRRQS